MNRKKQVEQHMEAWADEHYVQVAADLPNEGEFQYQCAISHLADSLYDQYHILFPEFRDYLRIAKRVARRYMSSDTKESRRNEERRERRYKERIARSLKPEQQLSLERAWDRQKPKRLGVGSY